MSKHIVYGIHLSDRVVEATEVQKIFTEYGCNIKTRLGLHDVNEKYCATNGIILLEMCGEEKRCEEMATRLSAIKGVEVQKMMFSHGA